MKSGKERRIKKPKWIQWIARIWSIPIIIYALLMFFGYGWNWITTGVADPYAVEGTSFLDALPVLFLFLAILGLIFTWRWERWGAIISLVFLMFTISTLLIQGTESKDFISAIVPYLLTIIVAIPVLLFFLHSYLIEKK